MSIADMTRMVLPFFYMSSVDDETCLASMFAVLLVGSMKNASTRCHLSRNLLHVDHVLFDDEMQRTARAHPTRGKRLRAPSLNGLANACAWISRKKKAARKKDYARTRKKCCRHDDNVHLSSVNK